MTATAPRGEETAGKETGSAGPGSAETGGVVRARLKYLAEAAGDTALYPSEAGAATTRYAGRHEAVEVAIADARRTGETFALDVHGFELMPHATAVTDFLDEAEVRDVYEPEVASLVRRVTGAREVHVFDHTLRADSAALRETRRMRDPAGTVHNDYTERSGPRRLRDLLPDEAEARLARRFAIVNLWRPIAGPVLSSPLALCDARSVAPGDLVPSERRAKNRVGEIHQATYSPTHRWYRFPRMTRDEALLIKTYDSATDGRSRFTIHSAFDDPTTPPGAPPRESIESRCFAFF